MMDLSQDQSRLQVSGSEDTLQIPISIFNNTSLSALEAITKYLKEDLEYSFRDISVILNRDERTIWGAYDSARKKMRESFELYGCSTHIPSRVLNDRSLGVLEAITEYLKDVLGYRYCQIASMTNRNDRTIWTVYNRAKNKRRKQYA